MNEPSIIFNEVNERQGVFSRRVFLLGGLTGAGLGVLTGRLAQLQLIQNKGYSELAKENQFNMNLIIPPRGLIIDRNGVTLASNRPNFRVLFTRDSVEDVDQTLAAIAQILPISEERLERLRKDIAASPRFMPVSVADDLPWEAFAAINVRAPELPGVTADMGEARVYPFGGAFAHVIGYVQRPSNEDLEATNSVRDKFTLHPAFRIGKVGVERAYELKLRGVPGYEAVEVDVKGRVVARHPEGDVEPKAGDTIQLTLDADVQNRALEVFGEESGSAVLMDCRTGDLLCMASSPSFDANKFITGMPSDEYRALMNYERRPLVDKAMSGIFPPGSTFKTMTALAALEAGIDPEERVVCGGSWYYGGRSWRCHSTHGSQNMHDAIKNSCDIYFYQTAVKMGPRKEAPDKIAEVARAFGLGQTFDIGIPGQSRATIVPDTAWKKAYYEKRNPANTIWFPGETPSVAIGQGALAVTCLQLAVMTARLANGKKALNPRMIRSIGGVEQKRGDQAPDLPYRQDHINYVRSGMAAVTSAGGTGFRASQLGLGDVLMAGKTGTAQTRDYGSGTRSNAAVEWFQRDHGLFVAFAPYDEPRYAMAVIVEHGSGGSTAAAPRAREIMRVALLKDPDIQQRVRQPPRLVDPDTGLPPATDTATLDQIPNETTPPPTVTPPPGPETPSQ